MSDAEATRVEALPPWFVTALVSVLVAMVGFGTIGVALAIAGAMAPLPTVVLGGATTLALLARLAPWRTACRIDGGAQLPAALTVAVSAGSTIFAIAHHAEHVLVDRDPGVYVVTARWLATHHNLQFLARGKGFQHALGLFFTSPGVYRHGGTVYFQFSHLTATLLAQLHWLGGDALMFAAPPILGGLGLLCFYALATRFVRPWIAFLAMAALACNLVEVHFIRDAYSELPTQIALLGGLWLLTREGPIDGATSLFTGLLLGFAVMARIDGPLYLVAIPFALAAAVMAARRHDADGHARMTAIRWLVAGALLTTLVGYADVAIRSAKYVHDLGNRVPLEYIGLVGACVAAFVIARAVPRLGEWATRAGGGRVPVVAGVLVAATLFLAWLARPHLQQVTKPYRKFTPEFNAQQRFYGIVAAGVRTRAERTMIWQSAYVGPILLAAAIVGVGLLVRDMLRGKGGRHGIVVATFLPVAAVYLWNPNIYSDQIWVMRRYLPYILPCLVLFAFVVVDRLVTVEKPSARLAARTGAAVLVAAAIAWPVHTVLPVRDDSTQHGFASKVDDLCHVMGPKAAALVLTGHDLDAVLPQTLRSFCNIPVAVGSVDANAIVPMHREALVDLAKRSKRAHRSFFVIAGDAARIRAVLPGVELTGTVTAAGSTLLQRTVSDRAHRLVREHFTFVVAPVPTE